MQEELIFRRRNRLKRHFVNTSNVLLYCYQKLSDAAKITFQIIDSFDWESKETEDSKGYVFPAVATIARLRRASERTIRRHILELINVNLLTRIRRRNKPSILYIEEVSDEEAETYFDMIQPQPEVSHHEPTDDNTFLRTDKNVRSDKAPQRTKMSVAYMKENELKENEINVNAHFKNLDKQQNEKRYGMQGISDIMKRFDPDIGGGRLISTGVIQHPIRTTDSAEKSRRGNPKLSKKSGSRQQTMERKSTSRKRSIRSDEKVKRDYFASQIATELSDEKSLGCYRVIAEHVPQQIIFETLGSVKETWRDGKIQKSRGALFVDLIKTYCEKKQIILPFADRTVFSLAKSLP